MDLGTFLFQYLYLHLYGVCVAVYQQRDIFYDAKFLFFFSYLCIIVSYSFSYLYYPLFRVFFQLFYSLTELPVFLIYHFPCPICPILRLVFRSSRRIGCCGSRPSRPLYGVPDHPGGCWINVLRRPGVSYAIKDIDLNRYGIRGWLDDRSLYRLTRYLGCPLLSIVQMSPQVYHVVPLQPSSGNVRTYRCKNLPLGWYGSGPLNADFFADTPLNTAVRAMHMDSYRESFRHSRLSTPFAVPKNLMHHITRAGLPAPVIGAPSHAHPVHVAFERLSLHIASRLLASRDWFALWLRPEKVNDVMIHTPGLTPPSAYWNPVYQAKDITRYRSSPAPATASPTSSSPVWFAHDVLHHLTPATVGGWFDANPTLKYLICTAVIPPETAFSLPSLNIDLYNFERRGSDLVYVPEGDNSGAYIQPYNAHRWLRCHRLVTPQSVCLHVGLVHTQNAHHLFVISREQLLPEKYRVLDMPELVSIPFLSHPFGSPFARLTMPSILAALTSYAVRASATGISDLYSKVASYQAEIYGRYPASYVRAAALHAVRSRCLDFHAAPTRLSFFVAWFGEVFSLPLVPFSWALQSLSSMTFATRLDVASIWTVDCKYLVSSVDDAPLPGLHNMCNPRDIPFFYIPPNATWSARLARFSASLHVFFLSKFFFYLVSKFVDFVMPKIFPYISLFYDVFDLDIRYLPLASIVFILTLWVGFRGPVVPLIDPVPPLRRFILYVFARIFFLPYAQPSRPFGCSVPYQLTLLCTTLMFLWPKLFPFVYYYDSPFVRYALRYFLLVPLLIFFVWIAQVDRNQTLPYHTDPDFVPAPADVESCYFTPASVSPASSFRTCPSPVLSTPLAPSRPATPGPSRPYVPPSFVEVPDESRSATPDTLRSAFLSSDASSVASSRAPTPPPAVHIAADPYSVYALQPRLFPDFNTWALLLRRLPPPPQVLNPQNSCVWSCLAHLTGLPVDLLHACFLSSLPVADRIPFQAGFVPYADLSRVFSFFGMGIEVRAAELHADQDCPSAPGAAPGFVEFNPSTPPLLTTTVADCGLSGVFYLARQPGDVFHLTHHAAADVNINSASPTAVSMIGYVSRQLSALEIGSLINFPVRSFLRSWIRLHQPASASAAMSGLPSSNLPAAVNLPAVPVRRETINYQLTAQDFNYACNLASDIKTHPHVLDLRGFDMLAIGRGLYELAKSARARFRADGRSVDVRLHLYHGAPGTGKTYQMLQDLSTLHQQSPFDISNLRFHTWLYSLRGPLEAAASVLFPSLLSHNFQTACMPFAQPLPGTLVLDDATQLWPGYIPLLIATNPGLTDIIVTFDASQGRSCFPESNSLCRADISTAEWLSALSSHYATESRRLSVSNSALFGLPVPALQPQNPPLPGETYCVSGVSGDIPLLVVSPRFATSKNEGGQRCMTFRECQGFTIDGDVTIDLGGLSATATDHSWWTALTRAKGNIFLFVGPLSQGSLLDEAFYGQSNIASSLLAVAAQSASARLNANLDPMQLVARAVQAHLSRSLSPAAAASLGLPAASPVIGSQVSASARQEWLDAPTDSFLQDFWTARSQRSLGRIRTSPSAAFSRHSAIPLNTAQSSAPHLLRHYCSLSNDSVLTVPPTSYVAPRTYTCNIAPDPALNFDKPLNEELREVVAPNTRSTMQDVKDASKALLHHTRRDPITVKMSEAKRIKVGVDHFHLNSIERGRLKQLKKGFAKFFDVPSWNEQSFDACLFDLSTREAYAPWVSKRSKRGILRSTSRNPIDAHVARASLFLKGQYIKKEHARFSPAKAGQTVSEFNLVKQFRDAPFALYVERLAMRYAFPSTYLHCRASPADMDNWYVKHWSPGPMVANDYTAWDSGCDRVFLHFDCWLLQLSGLPEEYISKYRHEKLNTVSHLGPHMCRQESGDRWTWLFNTLRNAAITGASLNCAQRTSACFSGDDSVVLGHHSRSPDFVSAHWAMTPKLEYGSHLEFCGYTFGSSHVSLSPLVVLHRAQNGISLGRNDPDYWRSISEAILESGVTASDFDVNLATSRHILLTAAIRYGFPIRGPLVFY